MTMQVNCPSKKKLKELLTSAPLSVTFYDPSFIPEWRAFGKAYFTLADVPPGATFVCTNHPKRSWFAEVTRTKEGAKVK